MIVHTCNYMYQIFQRMFCESGGKMYGGQPATSNQQTGLNRCLSKNLDGFRVKCVVISASKDFWIGRRRDRPSGYDHLVSGISWSCNARCMS